MLESNEIIITINLVLGTVLAWLIAKWYILPNVRRWNPKQILLPILLLEASRYVGMTFLASGVILKGMPEAFAYPAAYGDLVTSLLAFASLYAVVHGLRATRLLLWTLTIVGTIDLFGAIIMATISGAPAYMGAAWWIPTLWVPLSLVGHYVIFVLLRQKKI